MTFTLSDLKKAKALFDKAYQTRANKMKPYRVTRKAIEIAKVKGRAEDLIAINSLTGK